MGWLVLSALVGRGEDMGDRLMLEAVEMTRAGKKLAPPTAEHPTYYLPVFLGYKELGSVTRYYQRKPESDQTIRRQLVAMLARQNYRIASKASPPTLVLVFEWGSISPVYRPRGSGTLDESTEVINAAEIRMYVVGDNNWKLDVHDAHYDELSRATARHFLLISAFEFRTNTQKGEVLLWRAHVTTDLWGNYLAEVLPTMIAHAAPILGKEMRPGASWTPRVPHVSIGELKVITDPAAPNRR